MEQSAAAIGCGNQPASSVGTFPIESLAMPVFFWVDIVALVVSAVLASTLALTVFGSGPRRALNRFFAAFALFATVWAVLSVLLRLSIWLRAGAPRC